MLEIRAWAGTGKHRDARDAQKVRSARSRRTIPDVPVEIIGLQKSHKTANDGGRVVCRQVLLFSGAPGGEGPEGVGVAEEENEEAEGENRVAEAGAEVLPEGGGAAGIVRGE